jgi:hypothetical protein
LHVLYGGLDQDNKRELDLPSGGSFMEFTAEQAWIRLDKVHRNIESRGFDLGSEGEIEIEHDCLNSYENTGQLKETTSELNLDDDMVLDVRQAFTEFIKAPNKNGFIIPRHLNPLKQFKL